MKITAIILAAGESRRMGKQNKLLLEVDGKALIRHVVDMVVDSHVDECIVVVGHEGASVQAALEGLEVSFVENPSYREGMSTSIHAGIIAAGEEAAGYMMCLSDMPAIEKGEYDQLLSAFRKKLLSDPAAIVVPRYNEQRGNPVLISAHFKSEILAHQGVMGCRSIVEKNPDHVYFHAMQTDHVLLDLDTPEALAVYRSR